nr:Xaa-Pro aminopeptidase P [Ipomoea batatas]
MKLKTLLQTFIFSHLYRIARAVAKAKSILLHLLKDIHVVHLLHLPLMMKKSHKNKNTKLFLGSFRLHYNWCSSHDPKELSGYLHWLEEKGRGGEENNNGCRGGAGGDDIDRLADMFIANSHERFRLEKVESYRRFQEMLARSV